MLESPTAEFLAIYGRRRVGKKYLVKNFCDTKENLFVYVTGIKNGTLKEQLKAATESVNETLLQGVSLEVPKNWMAFLKQLTTLLKNHPKRIVLFFDEIPWLAHRKSKFLNALDYYWNRY